ncbi:hypothetical protein Micbo1qcDRAFT_209068 [Microdochium bolleyi]|uniref:Alcohol dehydrogenase-like C-terminal domain-containing protein n=1 Tax=Microdochium bolleyi TaxID=196109 RepID=A0A136INB2_9PEZI|nr:hypothetical protein Micbo1qcDRAFT_209068 [Microdochium bolleyi]
MVFKIPSNLPESHAAALTSVVMTAAHVLHNLFKFPLPTARPADSPSPILIWGASSAVGLSALQLARASGFSNIFVTGSPARHDLLRSLGATRVFDYAAASVVADIKAAVEALGKGPISHALDAAGTMGEPSSADLMAQSVTDEAVLCSVVLRPGTKFLFLDSGSLERLGALHWAITNYGTKFEVPSSINFSYVQSERK